MSHFKTRARALDMLGRQQIAGIPTAISELFKNAYDAYADRVEVDFYRFNNLFVLRDNGVGMTKQDFEQRWLTIGTESKVRSVTGSSLPPLYPGKEPRPIMGEKGIGRLAIGIIGPQVLVLTRALGHGQSQDLVAAFLNWKIFEVPGINLNDIEVPVVTFPDGNMPTKADIDAMLQVFRGNLDRLRTAIGPIRCADIESDLTAFTVDPVIVDSYVKNMSLSGSSCGTHFYILPASENLAIDIDGTSKEDAAPPMIQMLTGFSNTMLPGNTTPLITASFRDYKTKEYQSDIISTGDFWTPSDFQSSDHRISGSFNDYGQFEGEVAIYGREPVHYVAPWLPAAGRPTDCGPFTINFCYVQGEARASKLTPEAFNLINQKLRRIGGLYVYKDGIRVLPYGTLENDFLNIERNRNKGAAYYFFSYRRMFGAIEISQDNNPNLNEKAGREGFRENRAYRQFRSMIQDLLIQLAGDFFREEGIYSNAFTTTKADLERTELARRRRESQISEKRKILRAELDNVFVRLDAGKPHEEMASLLNEVSFKLNAAARLEDSVQAGNLFIETEAQAREAILALRNNYRVSKPRGMGLSKELNRDWQAYLTEYQHVEGEVFQPATKRLDELVGNLAHEAKLSIDRRRRIEHSLQSLTSQARKTTQFERKETEQTANLIKDHVVSLAKNSLVDVEETTKRVFSRFAQLDVSHMDETIIVSEREHLENDIREAMDRNKDLLENVREQLNAINLTPDAEGRLIGASDQTEDLEQRLIVLQESADADLELAQLGMAIDVINHEFDGTVKSIRNNLRRLKGWADLNQGLQTLYGDLRASFDHLDGYLTLFTPLHRRLYRNKVEISGADIGNFLEDLFQDRLKRHQITLEQSTSFRRKKIFGYPSTFYPVFVNLVENAIFWTKDRINPRVIRLDTDSESFLVSDNGPGIPIRDQEAVFEYGFSRKPGGRGMGLQIARRTLEEASYRLVLRPFESGRGATFRIEPNN